MLWKRVATAFVALPIFIPLFIWGGEILNFILFLAVVMLSLSEYFGMAFPNDRESRRFGIILGSALYAAWGLQIIFDYAPTMIAMTGVAAFLFLFMFFLFRVRDLQTSIVRMSVILFGLIYINLLLIHMIGLLHMEDGYRYIITLLAIVWMTDTGGYFFGKSIGKHSLYKISPKKTWEGAIGGTLLSMVAAFICNWLMDLGWTHHDVIIISVGVSAIGQVGDLCESLLKRSFGIKDSGQIIPGHGGILDRIDAVMFAAPFLYYSILFL